MTQGRLQYTPQSHLALGAFDLEGRLHCNPQAKAGEEGIVWVPTAQLLCLSVTVPGKNAKLRLQALPYAIEDQLAEPIEAVHIAVLNHTASGEIACAVVSRVRMQQWVEALQVEGLEKAALVPDIFQLPIPNDASQWSIFEQDGWVWVRQSPWQGFACEVSVLPVFQQKCQVDETQIQRCSHADLVTPEGHRLPMNLRQGKFRVQSSGEHLFWKRWRWPVGLAAALLVVSLLNVHWESRLWQQQAALYQQQAKTLFHQLFPNVKRIVNLTVQTRQQLQALQSGSPQSKQPIQFLKATETVWRQSPQVQLEQIIWQKQRWQFQVSAKHLEAINALVKALQQRAKADFPQSQIAFKVGQLGKQQVTGEIDVRLD